MHYYVSNLLAEPHPLVIHQPDCIHRRKDYFELWQYKR